MTRHVVGPLSDLPDGEARRVVVDDQPIAVVRLGDRVHAIGDTCSHADYSLSEGEVWVEDCSLECFKHGSLFSLETGQPTNLPATRPVPVYEVDVLDGEVVVVT